MIDLVDPLLIHDQFAQKQDIPKNGGKKIEFRKYLPLPKALKPIQEGVTPKGNSYSVTTITAQVFQYGDYLTLTDLLQLTAIDNNIIEATKLISSQAGRTLDTVTREVINGGTNVIFAPTTDDPDTEVTGRHLLTSDNKFTADMVFQAKTQLIDMHMWNHEEVRAGDVSCLNLYTEILPFLDSIWLGEGFFYKKYSPEYMLAEVSGIPYGVTGQMLEGGGDFYIGMLYGMNNRYGWGYTNATEMYKVWDDFGIIQSKMLGYWHSENPVHTSNENVLATVYLKENEALVCLYNFSNSSQKFTLNINKELLGFSPKSSVEIKFGKKSKHKVSTDKILTLKKRKGIIIDIKG